MELSTAVILSAVAQAGGQYVSSSIKAKAGAKRAAIEAKANKTNADLAELQAIQQENDRRDDYFKIEASNNASINFDPLSSPSFLAIKEENESTLARDINNIQLMGMANKNRFLQSAEAAKIEESSFRSAGRYAWLQPVGTLTEGYYKSEKIKTG